MHSWLPRPAGYELQLQPGSFGPQLTPHNNRMTLHGHDHKAVIFASHDKVTESHFVRCDCTRMDTAAHEHKSKVGGLTRLTWPRRQLLINTCSHGSSWNEHVCCTYTRAHSAARDGWCRLTWLHWNSRPLTPPDLTCNHTCAMCPVSHGLRQH